MNELSTGAFSRNIARRTKEWKAIYHALSQVWAEIHSRKISLSLNFLLRPGLQEQALLI